MSLPSITTLLFSAIFCCKETSTPRTLGSDATTGTFSVTLLDLISHETSTPLKSTVLCLPSCSLSFGNRTSISTPSANSTNLSFQYSGIEFIKSVELDALSTAISAGYGSNGYWIAVPMGTVATLDWIPVQNRNAVETKVNKYGTIIHPSTGLTLATHEYEARADESGNNSDNQDVKFENQTFIYNSFNHSPLTTADETPLQAFAFVP